MCVQLCKKKRSPVCPEEGLACVWTYEFVLRLEEDPACLGVIEVLMRIMLLWRMSSKWIQCYWL